MLAVVSYLGPTPGSGIIFRFGVSQSIFGQHFGKVVKRKYVDSIIRPQYRSMGIDDYPTLQTFEIGDRT